MSAANWWDGNKSGGVVAHTPDETKYHYPDSTQTSHMRGGIGSGVIIPRANEDGTSKGFDGRMAGMVHVDPEAPDGGTIVDLTQLNQHKLRSAFSKSQMPHEVYYQLGQSPQEAKQAQLQTKLAAATPPRSNPHVPSGTYVVPQSYADGTQLSLYQNQEIRPVQPVPPIQPSAFSQQYPEVQPTQSVEPVPYQPQAQAYQPQPQQYQPAQPVQPTQPTQPTQPVQQPWNYPPQSYQPPTPPGQYDHVMQSLGQLTQVVGGLAQQMNHMMNASVPARPHVPPQPVAQRTEPVNTQPVPPTTGGRRMRPIALGQQVESSEETSEVQTIEQVTAAIEGPRQGVIAGFEALNMPFVTGPLPLKAKKSVYFALPDAGTMSAKYHAIVDSRDCLVLVYDSRYEDGNQYLPPDLGAAVIEIAVHQGRDKENKKYRCTSPGLAFSLGVLDMVVLIKVPQPGPDDQTAADDED